VKPVVETDSGVNRRLNGAPASDRLLDKARADTETVLQQLASQSNGLSAAVAASRLTQYGFNEIAGRSTNQP
jgi:hypothetical protein